MKPVSAFSVVAGLVGASCLGALLLASMGCASRSEHGYIVPGDPSATITCVEPGTHGNVTVLLREVTVCSLPADPSAAAPLRAAWAALVPPGMMIRQVDGLVQVERGTEDLVASLVTGGLAVVKPADVATTERYAFLMAAQTDAQRAKRGMWAEGSATVVTK